MNKKGRMLECVVDLTNRAYSVAGVGLSISLLTWVLLKVCTVLGLQVILPFVELCDLLERELL